VSDMKQRLAYLDNIKAISIILVVFCHYTLLSNNTVIGNIFMTMAWGAVPCFMMVSGGLMNTKSVFSWKKHLRNIISTYVVICIWRIIYIVIHILINGFIYSYKDIFKCVFFFDNIDGIDLGVFWYMIAYLMIQIIFPVTWTLFHSDNIKAYLFIWVVSFLQGIFIPSVCIGYRLFTGNDYLDSLLNMTGNVLPFSEYSNMLFYFMLGGLLLRYRQTVKEKLSLAKSIIIFIMGLVALVCEKFYATKSWGWNNNYINDGYARITTCLIAVGIFLIIDHLSGEKENFIGKTVGSSTLGIYYMHFIILIVSNGYLYNLIPGRSFLMNCIKTIIVVFFTVIVTLILKKIPVIRKLVM
jgi:surface polysaccharide O-acyltransferase-like enzyme